MAIILSLTYLSLGPRRRKKVRYPRTRLASIKRRSQAWQARELRQDQGANNVKGNLTKLYRRWPGRNWCFGTTRRSTDICASKVLKSVLLIKDRVVYPQLLMFFDSYLLLRK